MTKLFRLLIFNSYVAIAAASLGVGDPGFSHCEEPLLTQTSAPDTSFSIEAFFAGALKDNEILWPLLLALMAGFLTSLSPCVYPLIPITLSIMGARKYESRLHGTLVAATYVLGMSTVYTALGALFASLGIVAGSLMQNSIILIVFALIFFIMALALLGAFEVRLPSKIINRLSRIGGRGFKGAFLMGLVAGFIAAPCTGPVLGAILALIAHDQNIAFGIVLMGSFSLGLGLPFLALGAFSSAMLHLPKSGAWMNAIKYILGAITFGTGIYFLAQALVPVREILFKFASISNILILFIIIGGILLLACVSHKKLWRLIGTLFCGLGVATLLYEQAPAVEAVHVSKNAPHWHLIDTHSKDTENFRPTSCHSPTKLHAGINRLLC